MIANKKELVGDLVSKAKQIELLIQSMPVPESEESQVLNLQKLEEEMQQANEEYIAALDRASGLLAIHLHAMITDQVTEDLHAQVTEVLRDMLDEPQISTVVSA